MTYTCPKCGKNIALSDEALAASGHYTVCPQCLTRLQIVGDYAYVPTAAVDLSPSGDAPAAPPQYPPPVPAGERQPAAVEPTAVAGAPAAVDPLFGAAVQFVSRCNAVTPMMLRDHLQIPLERAQALMATLEEAGVVGPYNGGAPRTILIPHNSGLPTGRPAQQPDGGDTAAGDEQPRRTLTFSCSGCLMWSLLAMLLVALLRSCGG